MKADSKFPRARKKRAVSEQAAAGRLPRDEQELKALQYFRMIFGSARAHDSEVRRIAAISGSQLWALAEIARAQGLSVNALSARMALHQTTASNLVNALVQRKLIERVRDSADLRVVRLRSTTEGKRMLLRAPGPYSGLLVDALRSLQPDQLAGLRKALEGLVNQMRATASTAAGETLLGD